MARKSGSDPDGLGKAWFNYNPNKPHGGGGGPERGPENIFALIMILALVGIVMWVALQGGF